MSLSKPHFNYNKRERNGVFYLLLIIVILQLLFYFVDFSSKETDNLSQIEVASFQQQVDSLQIINAEQSKPKIYLFNPNYITDFKGYQLGMSVEEIDRLLSFRKTGKFINSKEQFQKITLVNDSLLEKISPLFKFPDWVSAKKKTDSKFKEGKSKKEIIVKDINAATVKDLILVYGVGDKLANRIINYKIKLQGYSYNNQLYEVWYLDKTVADEVLKYFKVKEMPSINKINVNEASFKEVLSIVYIDYELTKKIFSYRDEVAEIQSIEELKKIDGFPIEKFDRIALYLVAE